MDDVNYNEHPDKDRYERQWLATLMRNQIQQGIYVASSAGKYLGRMNRGWPDPDADGTLAAMKEAVAAYKRLASAERKLQRTLTDADRLRWEHEKFIKPEGTLDLRISRRGYPFSGMTTFDQRHPKFYHLDRLWFKPSEWRAWLPSRLEKGAKTNVTGPAYNRIVLLSHMQAGQSAWWESHIREGGMTSEVTEVRGNIVSLRITARYVMKGDSEWCTDTYNGNLLATADYDSAAKRFTKFELAMLGTHRVGRMMENLHVGSQEHQIGAYATLNTGTDRDNQMLPQSWKYGYSLRWAQTP